MSITVTGSEVEAATAVPSLTPAQVEAHQICDRATIIDVRGTADLDDQGFIAGAVHVPLDLLEHWADPASPSHRSGLDPARRTIVYGATGARSPLAVQILHRLGYVDVVQLKGGIEAWKRAGLPVAGLESWHTVQIPDPIS